MKIVGCDLHTRYQQVAMLDQETGELIERRLEHESGEARAFYAGLSSPVRVGIEATGHTRWFERMLAELGQELWIGDAAGETGDRRDVPDFSVNRWQPKWGKSRLSAVFPQFSPKTAGSSTPPSPPLRLRSE
jgi:hypothetical protein